jgi:hypothetical protein
MMDAVPCRAGKVVVCFFNGHAIFRFFPGQDLVVFVFVQRLFTGHDKVFRRPGKLVGGGAQRAVEQLLGGGKPTRDLDKTTCVRGELGSG